MSLHYLFDTDICIYLLKNRPENLMRRLETVTMGEVGMSMITYGELMFGIEKSQQQKQNLAALSQLIRIIPPIEIKSAVAKHYGAIRLALEKIGRPIGNNDLWIAAHAASLNVTLITNNTREFSRIPELKVENWMQDQLEEI